MIFSMYLDDLRACPEGWQLVQNIREAQRFVEANQPITYMSLDHDLGMVYCRSCAFSDADEPCLDDRTGGWVCGCTCHVPEPSGFDFLKWINEKGYWPKVKPMVHSANPIGARRMRDFINDFGPYEK